MRLWQKCKELKLGSKWQNLVKQQIRLDLITLKIYNQDLMLFQVLYLVKK